MGDQVRVTKDRVEVKSWTTERPDVVRWFDERLASDDGPDAAELLELAVAAGVLALRTANAAVDAEYVAREFERLLGAINETVDGHDDRLAELFDPERRDSVVGAIREVMAEHVDGRDSKMARLLDLSNDGSPLHAVLEEIRNVRAEVEKYRSEIAAEEAAEDAWEDEYEVGTGKGRDFEDVVLNALAEIAAVPGDSAEPVGDISGSVGRSKAGDVVVTLSPRETRGVPVRVGVEAKDSALGGKAARTSLDATKANREASAAIIVFAREDQMPKGTAPFADLGENRFVCLLDKDDPDDTPALKLAYRLARHWALADALAGTAEIDVRAMHEAVDCARSQLESFTGIKRKVTTLEKGVVSGVKGIREELDRARLAFEEAFDRLDEALEGADEEPESSAA